MKSNTIVSQGIFTSFLCLLITADVWANKFETIGGGVSGSKELKLDWLVNIGAGVGAFFVLLGIGVLLFKRHLPKATDAGYRPVLPTRVPVSLIIFGILAALPYLLSL